MSEFIEFEVDDPERFDRLRTVFGELKKDKDSDEFRPENEWLHLFDEDVLARFHWPTSDERSERIEDLKHRPIRITPTEDTTGLQWDFFSMIDAFEMGEYELLDCGLVAPTRGRLEFYVLAYPYGGVGCMVALIEAFGFNVTGIDDGTGFRNVE